MKIDLETVDSMVDHWWHIGEQRATAAMADHNGDYEKAVYADDAVLAFVIYACLKKLLKIELEELEGHKHYQKYIAREDNGEFFFYDEIWCHKHGPYETEVQAVIAHQEYCASLNGSKK